jgi:acyl-CoA synthetase (AMP-forming)/AMP-acid ligase II
VTKPWTSAYEPVVVDDATLPGLVLAQPPERPALIDDATGQVTSHGALAAGIEQAARPDGVALWAPNSPGWAAAALGAMAGGGWATGVHPLATDRELATQLEDSGASALVTAPPLAARARAVAHCEVLVLGEPPTRPAAPRAPRPGDLALLPYSSGTTGLPKGVLLTHRNLAASVRQLGRHLRVTERDVVLAVAPFPHVMGFVVTCALPLCSGATVVTMPGFDFERLLAAIERRRVTVLVVAPPVISLLARHPLVDDHDLSSLELIVSGGAPLGAALHAAAAARLGTPVGQGWGLTETTVGVTGPDRATGSVPGSVGRVLPGTELRVVDPETGRDLGPGEDGELLVRGPQCARGYLHADEPLLDPAGWLRTGDLGRVDREGDVWIAGRLKELIKVGGLQVAPAELEALLATHPHVADAAVVPEPDSERGEVPVALVVPRGELDPGALKSWIAERVAPHKRIRAVHQVDAIPRTPSGKILRRQLESPSRTRSAAGV